jgi:acylpyruvate hydrolase
MRLGTLRVAAGTAAVRLDDTDAVEIDGYGDVGELLAQPDWRAVAAAASGTSHALDGLAPDAWAPVVPAPSKVICVGLNYRAHILEMGRELPDAPTLFPKYAETLIGPGDTLVLPREAATQVDWEGELAIVIGSPARRLDDAGAGAAIAGYTVLNDVSMRDWQYRTTQWMQGKMFEATTPVGGHLVTADAFRLGAELRVELNGELMQSTPTDDMVFGPEALVAYISQIITLQPGDLIATGTPGGVWHARDPQRYLADGDLLVTSIDGLGELRTPVAADR